LSPCDWPSSVSGSRVMALKQQLINYRFFRHNLQATNARSEDADFCLLSLMAKLPLELFPQGLVMSSKNPLTSPSRHVTPKNVQTQKCPDFFNQT